MTATRLLYLRLLRQELRSPLALVNLFIALFFLAVYTGALGGAPGIERLVGGDYLTFVLPVTVLNAAIAGTSAGQVLVADLESGYLRRLLTLPVSRRAIVLAAMLAGATQVLLQASAVVLLALALGAESASGLGGWAVVLGLALLWGVAFAGYAVATGLLAGTAAGAQTATFVFFPLTFLAPTFLPRDALEGWLATVSAANPTTYVLEAMRAVLLDGDAGTGTVALGFAVVGGLALLTLRWGTAVAGRVTRRT